MIFGNYLLSSFIVVIDVAVVLVEVVVLGLFLVLFLSVIVPALGVVLSDLGNLDVAVMKTELSQ